MVMPLSGLGVGVDLTGGGSVKTEALQYAAIILIAASEVEQEEHNEDRDVEKSDTRHKTA